MTNQVRNNASNQLLILKLIILAAAMILPQTSFAISDACEKALDQFSKINHTEYNKLDHNKQSLHENYNKEKDKYKYCYIQERIDYLTEKQKLIPRSGSDPNTRDIRVRQLKQLEKLITKCDNSTGNKVNVDYNCSSPLGNKEELEAEIRKLKEEVDKNNSEQGTYVSNEISNYQKQIGNYSGTSDCTDYANKFEKFQKYYEEILQKYNNYVSIDRKKTDACQNEPDTDSDGRKDYEDTDDDNDGLTDEEEKNLGSNPLKKDSDDDNKSDIDEVSVTTTKGKRKVKKKDTDGDEKADINESITLDSDSDSVADERDGDNGNPNNDQDKDGVANIDEKNAGTDPLDKDSKPRATPETVTSDGQRGKLIVISLAEGLNTINDISSTGSLISDALAGVFSSVQKVDAVHPFKIEILIPPSNSNGVSYDFIFDNEKLKEILDKKLNGEKLKEQLKGIFDKPFSSAEMSSLDNISVIDTSITQWKKDMQERPNEENKNVIQSFDILYINDNTGFHAKNMINRAEIGIISLWKEEKINLSVITSYINGCSNELWGAIVSKDKCYQWSLVKKNEDVEKNKDELRKSLFNKFNSFILKQKGAVK